MAEPLTDQIRTPNFQLQYLLQLYSTSQLCLNDSQEPCELVDGDFGVLRIESEQILH